MPGTRPTEWMRPLPIVPHPTLDGVSMVPLTNGGHALIDSEDECRVDQIRWTGRKVAGASHDLAYAIGYIYPNGKKTFLQMHRYLFGLDKSDRVWVDHGNHDGLDNRRSNLRLATPKQNGANRRKTLKSTSSPYRGACWSKKEGRWKAATSINSRAIGLGTYDTAEEAAIASQSVAGLVRAKGFIHLDPIPPGLMPSPERAAEIRRYAREVIRRRMAGEKAVASKSRYRGVSYIKSADRWRPMLMASGTKYDMGYYKTEHEAAIAWNALLDSLDDQKRTRNVVPADEMPNPERIAKIRDSVRSKLRLDRVT